MFLLFIRRVQSTLCESRVHVASYAHGPLNKFCVRSQADHFLVFPPARRRLFHVELQPPPGGLVIIKTWQ